MTTKEPFAQEIQLLDTVATSFYLSSIEKEIDPGEWAFPVRLFIETLRAKAGAMKQLRSFDAKLADIAKELLITQYNVNVRGKEFKKLMEDDRSADPDFPSGRITKEDFDRILNLAFEIYELGQKNSG